MATTSKRRERCIPCSCSSCVRSCARARRCLRLTFLVGFLSGGDGGGEGLDIKLALILNYSNPTWLKSGDRLGKGAMAKVVGVLQAHMDGDFETRLKGKQRALECWMDMKFRRWCLTSFLPPRLT